MINKNLMFRYGVFVVGLYFLSLGIVLIVNSSLGTTPISSVNYVVSLNTPITLGTATFAINMLLILGQFWLIRDRRTRKDVAEIMLQIPFSFIFGAFIDLNMQVFAGVHPGSYLGALGLLAAGCLVQAVGVTLELKPRVSMMSAEAFVKYAADRYSRRFGSLKVCFVVTLVTMAVILSLFFSGRIEGVREGSVVAAVATGYIVTFLSSHLITGTNLRRIKSVARLGRHATSVD